MRRHNAFPRPGDRIRLAVPLPSDTSEPHARYGTVLERSCGRSNALRVRWDGETGTESAGTEAWLADAGWYWDKAHLEVMDGSAKGVTIAAAPAHKAATEEETWLSATPAASNPSGGVDGSLDAVAEWEAALASEIGGGAEVSWEELLASALRHGTPVAAARAAAPAPEAARRPVAPPPPLAAESPVEFQHAPQAVVAHKDVRKPSPSSDAPAEEPEVEQAPVAAPVLSWKGDDILPTPRAGRRWGRR